jgi:hypothetical protein
MQPVRGAGLCGVGRGAGENEKISNFVAII